MKSKLLQWLQWSAVRGKLAGRLMCIYFLLIVLPLGMFSFYAYMRVRDMIQEQTFLAAQNAFDDTCMSLEHLLGRSDGVIDILATDPLIYTMASNDPRDYTYIRRLEDSDQLAATFAHLRMLADVDLIRLYVNNDYPYSNANTGIVRTEEVEKIEWYQTASADSRRLWCAPSDFEDASGSPDTPCFSSLQMIYDPRNIREPLALLRVDIDAARVEELVNGTSVTENGLILLLREDDILFSSNAALPIPHVDTLVKQVEGLATDT